jgi:hypothetical protein
MAVMVCRDLVRQPVPFEVRHRYGLRLAPDGELLAGKEAMCVQCARVQHPAIFQDLDAQPPESGWFVLAAGQGAE